MKLEHAILDIWPEDPEIIKFVHPLKEIITSASMMGGANIIYEQWHQFSPFGVTGFLLLQESHISIHTWPEENFAAIDIFPCGSMNTTLIIDILFDKFKPSKEKITRTYRGET